MKKRTILIILIIFLVLIVSGFLFFNQNSNQETPSDNNHLNVGDLNFTLPDGYSGNLIDELNANLTNGNDLIFITRYYDDNITTHVDNYITERSEQNQTVEVSNFTVNSIIVTKATNMNTGANHYWFSLNGKVYSIYSWSKIDNMDNITSDLIKSAMK